MCGIAGIFAYGESAPPVDRDELLRIREAMSHRGPDGEGLWISPDRRTGLAHKRLSIIDLSDAGAQPMATADSQLWITFNGEIYNYRELRQELEGKGFRFRSTSDTEVLLHLYADRGPEMVHALRGMYAFGIWDGRNRELFLARDPFGIKPLYYADSQGTFRFATLVNALIEGGHLDTDEDMAGIGGFYLFGSVPDPFTFYRSVRSLPAGATLRVDRRGPQAPATYFSLSEEFLKAEAAPSTMSPSEVREAIRGVLHNSMSSHMVADVPVGIFLSGGVDSSALTALGSELSPERLHAITLGCLEYQGTANDETILAHKTAVGLGIQHTISWVQRKDFFAEYERVLSLMDQASVDGVNTYMVAKCAAGNNIKVAISGLGGDELFGGYSSFRTVPRLRRWTPRVPALGRALRAISAPVLGVLAAPKYAGVLEYGATYAGAYFLRRAVHMPWELPSLLGRERAEAALTALRPLEAMEQTIQGLKNERCIVTVLELSWYMRQQLLRDSDWAGMAHGVEIRVPFVDVTVVRTLAPIITGRHPPTKTDLTKAIPHRAASEIAQRPKTGFSVPVREWLQGTGLSQRHHRGLRDWCHIVGRRKGKSRFLSFVTDAFGGHGGIALYNRDLLQAVCSSSSVRGGVAIPRLIQNPPEPLPANLTYIDSACGGKLRYLIATLRLLSRDRNFDLVLCSHINLIPLAYLASHFLGAPLILVIYGIESWRPPGNRLADALARRARWVVSISDLTAQRFLSWSGRGPREMFLVPNAIHTDWYSPGAPNPDLAKRYGLEGKAVLMTLGRLVASERYKGVDEVLEAMPSLVEAVPNIAYLIVGSGSDTKRLKERAAHLGIKDRVVFTGHVPEAEKADHYRLADAYVMPSRGEGFGFVLLEAMACGVPVVASRLDGGREAVRDGQLGILVEPDDREALKRAVIEALGRKTGRVPPGLEYFSFVNFESRVHSLVKRVLSARDHTGS